MKHAQQNFAALAGRILVAAIFLMSGFNKMGAFDATAAMMASVGLPMANVLLVATIAIELVAGALLVLGWNTRAAALVLFLFMIPVTAVFHNPWAAADAAAAQQQMIHFLKNLAIMGGLLNLVAFGAGGYSLGKSRSAAAGWA